MMIQEIKFLDLEAERLTTMLKALSHPVRLEIVQMLSASGDAACHDFTRHAGLAQSTISEHLRVLREAGLVRQCGPGPRSGFCIDKAGLIWMKQALVAL